MTSPLILYRIEQLTERASVTVEERSPRGKAQLQTHIELSERAVARDYCEAPITHTEAVELTAILGDEVVEQVVAVRRARAFYSRRKRLFVLDAPRALARAIVARLSQNETEIAVSPVRLDLGAVLEQLPGSASILGAWATSRAPSSIRSRALFGSDLGPEEEFRRIRAGELSSLSLRYPFAGRTLRVNVSRFASVLVFGTVELETRLRFVEQLGRFEAQPTPNEPATPSRAQEAIT